MFCTACGVKNPADSNFCKQCGKALEKPVKIDESDYIHAMPEDEQARALLESAYQHRARGDFEGAIGLCEEAIRIHPNSAAAHALIAQIALQQGDKARAISEYERLLQLNPGSVADRMKLNELRAGKNSPARPGAVAVREGGSLNPLLVVAACAVLLAVGWVMNEQWRNRAVKGGGAPQSQAGLLQNPTQSQLPPQNSNFTGAPNTQGSSAPANAQGGNPSAQPPNDGTLTLSAPPFYPPVTLTTAQIGRNDEAPANYPRYARGGGNNSGLPPFNPQNAGGVEEIYRPTPGTRVHLDNGSDKDTDKDPPKYVVHIEMPGKNAAGSTAVAPPPSAGNAIAPDPIAIETRQALEAASNSMQRNDFDGAIRALKSAQKNPGAQAGRIHQDLAYCYLQKGNKATAKTHYEQAIAEYEAQSKQGVQKELAESGIHACKTGIKQCD